jgi:hypothetical protein
MSMSNLLMKKAVSKIFWWTLFVLLDCLIAFGISEGWIRLFVPVKNICYMIDAKIGVRFCPNQKTYGYVEKGYKSILVTNNLGFHDIDRNVEKSSGSYRIQMYGDSFVQGAGVDRAETVPSLVEKALNSKDSSMQFEVMNMATGEDGTSPELLTYEEIGKNFHPDLVILYFRDDFPDNVMQIHGRGFSPYHKIDSSGQLVYIPPAPKDAAPLWETFKKSSMLYRLLAIKILESKNYNDILKVKQELLHTVSNTVSPDKRNNKKSPEETRKTICINESWPLTLRLIQSFKYQAEKNGSHFMLVDGQEFHDINVGTVYSNKDLEEFSRMNHINYIPSYKKHSELTKSENTQRYMLRDGHLTALGNKEMSVFLADEIRTFFTRERYVLK